MFTQASTLPSADRADSHGRFLAAARALIGRVTGGYGVVVTTGDVGASLKGDLDGAEIVIGADSDPETALFLVAHLFGHTVQWNTSPTARMVGMAMPSDTTAARLDELEAYEAEACRYSQTLFHEAGVHDFDQWLADYSACDRAYLRHFYATGARREFQGFWRPGQPLLEPLPIPPFTPRRWRRRGRGIVV